MTLEKGSLVLIDYTAKVKDTNEIFETTLNEEAKNLGSYDPSGRYEPRLVSIGDGWVIKGLDEVLSNSNTGDKIDIDIPPEKGFGLRDPRKVRMIPQRKLGEKADELRPGDTIDIDDRKAIVRFIGSGRVQIDFNHRFAGKTLNYNVNILKTLTDDQEKIISLMKRRLPVDADKVKININLHSLSITIPDDQTLVDGIQIIKKAIANDIFRYLPTIKNIQIIEEYLKPEPKAEEPKAEEPKAEEPKAEEPKDKQA
ncbi:MAG TPA: FKBP-type peptidyl-prolyl cis-trans isomerase [Nitrososphaeraceae archaeon]